DRFEAYLTERLALSGHTVTRHGSKAAQLAHGDLCVDGDHVEIKYDDRLAATENLYIEVAEKHDPRQATWVPSGIWAGSDAAWYVIGNAQRVYVFRREDLRWFSTLAREIEIKRGT